jgi:hypothetical protein
MTRAAVLALALALTLGPVKAQQSVITPATAAQISIAGTVATITKIVSGQQGKSIYVTAVGLVPVSTSVVTFSSGTGTNCGTNTANVTGALTFASGQTFSLGSGLGAVWVLPQGADLCITIGTAAAPGSLAYSIF